jgi:hypothetical protein
VKYAASLLKQGELVDAIAADYSSFAEQLLHCPCCKASVYLVKGHSRAKSTRTLRSGTISEVSACEIPSFFSHHQQEDPIECEAYNQTLNSDSVRRSVTIARNQRLEIFRTRFIEIFLKSKSLELTSLFSAANARKFIKGTRKLGVFFSNIPASLTSQAIPIPFYVEPIEPAIGISIESSCQTASQPRLVEDLMLDLLADKIDEKYKVDVEASQIQYASEALSFLHMPAQRKLLTEIYWLLVLEISGGICTTAGPKALVAAKDMGLSGNGLQGKVEQYLRDQLINTLVERKAIDLTEIRFPLTLLMTALLTIDWQEEFLLVQDL